MLDMDREEGGAGGVQILNLELEQVEPRANWPTCFFENFWEIGKKLKARQE